MAHTYDTLYSQDDSADIGFSASPRSESAIDKENDKAKPLAYRGKIKKGGAKPQKQRPAVGSRPVDGGDGRVPPVG